MPVSHPYSFQKLWFPSVRESTDAPSTTHGRQSSVCETIGYHGSVAVCNLGFKISPGVLSFILLFEGMKFYKPKEGFLNLCFLFPNHFMNIYHIFCSSQHFLFILLKRYYLNTNVIITIYMCFLK